MMEIQNIKQRRECCHLIVNAEFDASLTKKCSEENLIAGCRDIIDMGVSAAYKATPYQHSTSDIVRYMNY